MLFRSRRSNSGGGGGLSPRHVPSPVYERPSSAPVASVVQPQTSNGVAGGLHSVEERLRIVKRNRTRDEDLARTPPSPQVQEVVASDSASSHLPLGHDTNSPSLGSVPPSSAYPTFNTSRLSKHEQHVMDAMVREFTEVLFFAPS
ncbi:hypothetical protein NESM_000298700 [Novymonas esmeraldas]|uniref:Uncharacterized protein n=1 Tax=Novymonas esmeraldas TaxID=1808958 RepID=A0AAW0FG99_9TRYP